MTTTYHKIIHLLNETGKALVHGPWSINMNATNDVRKVTCPECLKTIEKGKPKEKKNA